MAVRVESYETWDNVQGGAVFLGTTGQSASLVNLGQVSSSGDGEATSVIDLDNGTVQNSGTIWADNVGQGAARAILLGAGGSIVNDGDIIATAIGGDAVAVQPQAVETAFPSPTASAATSMRLRPPAMRPASPLSPLE